MDISTTSLLKKEKNAQKDDKENGKARRRG